MKRWLKNRLNLVEDDEHTHRPTPHDDFEMAMRVEEALAAANAASKLVQAHTAEAQRLFGVIRREIQNTRAPGEAAT